MWPRDSLWKCWRSPNSLLIIWLGQIVDDEYKRIKCDYLQEERARKKHREEGKTDVGNKEEVIKFEQKGDEGLKTGLKPKVIRKAPTSLLEVESFLNEVKNILIKQVD